MLLILIILLLSVLLFQRPDIKSNQMIPLCHIATNVLLQYVKSSLVLFILFYYLLDFHYFPIFRSVEEGIQFLVKSSFSLTEI